MGERYSRGTMIGVYTPTDAEGGPQTIGTTAVLLVFSGRTKTLFFQGGRANIGTIYIGKSNVASNGDYAFIELDAGQWVSFDYNDANNALYAISGDADQTLLMMALVFNPDNLSSEL